MYFWTGAAMTSKLLKVRNEVIRKKKEVTQIILERMGNNMLKWYGHVACVKGHRWPKGIMTWSPEGRRGGRRPEAKWERKWRG